MILPDGPGARAAAVAALREGRLIGLPTETVYGLAADATNGEAVAAIFAAKGRPRFNPLIAHFAAAEDAFAECDPGDLGRALALRFWPGPLTLVAPRREASRVSLLASAGLDTLATRVPAHDAARAVIAALGRPLAAPSANRSGRLSPTCAADVAAELGAAPVLILDGGPCRHGLESTIVAIGDGPPRLLRPGALPRAAIEAVIGPLARPDAAEAPAAPGMLASHYAPRARLRLAASAPHADEAFLAFGPDAPAGALNLSASGDLMEAAANLFAHLRALDQTGVPSIAVAPIPDHGLGEAINDRLARAAAPR